LAEDLFETVIPRRIDDVNLLIENEDIIAAEAAIICQHQREDAEAHPGTDDIKISPYMDNLVKKGTDEDESAAIAVLMPLQEQGRSSKKY
jgi:hypothetical protein